MRGYEYLSPKPFAHLISYGLRHDCYQCRTGLAPDVFNDEVTAPACFMTSLAQTAQHKMAALMVVFSTR